MVGSGGVPVDEGKFVVGHVVFVEEFKAGVALPFPSPHVLGGLADVRVRGGVGYFEIDNVGVRVEVPGVRCWCDVR